MISQLQSELIQDSANIEKIKSDLAGAEQKYQDNTSGYKIACEAKKAEINTNISKFNTLLK